jgi:hypothetical protein
MKTLGLIVLMLYCLMLPASAQSVVVGACTQAKEDARAQIALADAALAEDRVAEASDLLRDARLLLTRDCGGEAALFIHGNSNLSDTAAISAPTVNPDGGVAFIRIANLSVDVDSGGAVGLNQQLNVTGLGFGEFTGLIPIPSGTHTFGSLTWDFASNSTWVLATTGVSSNQSVAIQPIAVIRNDLKGQARVRVVQAISGLGRVNVTSEEGVTFGDSLGWLGNQDTMIDPGDYILRPRLHSRPIRAMCCSSAAAWTGKPGRNLSRSLTRRTPRACGLSTRAARRQMFTTAPAMPKSRTGSHPARRANGSKSRPAR